MATAAEYEAAGVPSWQLGRNFTVWNRTDLATILTHFGIEVDLYRRPQNSKLNLLRQLDEVVQEHRLDLRDRKLILTAKQRDPDLVPNGTTRLEGAHRRAWHARLTEIARRPWRMNPIRPVNVANAQSNTVNNGALPAAVSPVATSHTLNSQPNPGFSVTGAPAFNTVGTHRTNREDPAVNVNERECPICLEHLNLDSFPKRKNTGNCNHAPDVCLSCLALSIETQLSSKRWDQINCPTCNQRMQYTDVKRFASTNVFGRYV